MEGFGSGAERAPRRRARVVWWPMVLTAVDSSSSPILYVSSSRTYIVGDCYGFGFWWRGGRGAGLRPDPRLAAGPVACGGLWAMTAVDSSSSAVKYVAHTWAVGMLMRGARRAAPRLPAPSPPRLRSCA